MSNARRPILTTVATLCAAVGVLAFAGAPANAAGVRSEVGSFGPGGPGSGVFEEPQSIAVEQSSGDVLVYQAGKKGIVYKFNAAGDKEDFSSTPTSNELTSVGGEAKESEIAVDNSSGPDKGDIYIATGEKLEIYSSAGKKEASLATKEEPCGVAVDPSGAVYVAFKEENTIRKYIPVTNPVKASNYSSSLSGVGGVCDIAADSAGDVYAAKTAGGVERYEASLFDTLPLTAIGTALDTEGVTLALDPSSGGVGGELYVDERSDVAEYVPPATRVASFGSLSGSYGVAEDHASGEVYAAKAEEGEVAIYGQSSEYPLTVRQAGFGAGTVQCEVGGGGPGACAGEYHTGTAVKLIATKSSGSEFKGFSEACTNASGPCEVTIDAATSVTATFALEGVAEHTLTVKATGLGSVSASSGAISNCASGGGVCEGSYPEGAEVELKPKLEQYYSVAWSGCTSVTPESICIVKIGAANASVSASYEDTRTITVIPAGSGKGSVSAATGTIKDCAIDEGKVTGVCSGTYEEVEEFLAATLEDSTVTWSGGCEPNLFLPLKCNVKPGTGDVTVTATFTPLTTDYTLAIDTTGGSGSGEVECKVEGGAAGACAPEYPRGTELTLVPKADGGSEFAGFSGGTGSAEACDTDTGECTFKLEADSGIDAPFDLIPGEHTLTIVTTGGSGSGEVKCDGGSCAPSYPEGATVKLSYVDGPHSSFEGWEELGSGIVTTPCVGKTSPCELEMESNVTVDAPFELNTFPLTVTKAGSAASTGLVTSSPAGIECGATCEASYEEGKKVTLTEKPEGSTFAGWSGGGCSGTASTCEVTISAAESVTATFNTTAVTEYKLKVVKAGSAAGTGLVTSSPAGIECGATCEASYEEGKKVTLTEKPEGSTFAGWSGGGCSGTASTCEVTISAAESVTATFNEAGHGTAHEFLGSFGPEGPGSAGGSGSGPFEEPSGVAVEQSSGDVYVYEAGEGGRIYKFNASGDKEEFSSTPTSNVIEGVGGDAFGEIAVDSASGPDHGDIYLATGEAEEGVKIYGPEGKYLETLPGKEPYGVAVGPSGDVYVSFTGESRVKEYAPVTEPVTGDDYVSSLWNVEHVFGIAVDAAGDVYAEYEEYEPTSEKYVYGVREYDALQFSVSEKTAVSAVEFPAASEPRGLAVDASGDVLIDLGSEIAEYEPSGMLAGTFGASEPGKLESSFGVAVSDSSGYVYAADHFNYEGYVNIYSGSSQAGLPVVSVEGVSAPGVRGATLKGTVNSKETPVEACKFEYGTEAGVYGHEVACSPAPPFSGDTAVPVSASVGGLEPDTVYYFRLVASNANGASAIEGSTGKFTTAIPGVAIDEESVSDVSASAAQLRARIDPRGADTSYYFQYGPTESYGTSIPAPPGVDIGSGEGAQSVAQQAQGLTPETTYHYRVIAVQGAEVRDGPDRTFTTQAAAGFALPDGREWEMVSPPNKGGAEPEGLTEVGGVVQASADGDAISYVADGPMPAEAQLEGARGPEPTQILSSRGPRGWASQDLSTANTSNTRTGVQLGTAPEYQFFSTSLALALAEPFPGGAHSGSLAQPPLSPPLSPAEAGDQEKTIYLRDDAPLAPAASEAQSYETARRDGELMEPENAGFLALVTEENEPGGEAFGGGDGGGGHEGLAFAGATADLSHVVFRSVRAAPGLYEWGPEGGPKGNLQPVSVLPEGKRVVVEGLGSPLGDARHAISNDGGLVFWTYESHLYVRDTQAHPEKTLQLDTVQSGAGEGEAHPVFQTASADGSKVFFTDTQRLTEGSRASRVEGELEPDLYMVELSGGVGSGRPLSGKLSDLTPEGVNGESAGVVGEVLGASEDGSYVYFVADGALPSEIGGRSSEATRGDCSSEGASRPPGTTCNLYVDHYDGTRWTVKLIAALSSEDLPDWGGVGLARMTSRVSPDGEYLAFMSDRSLTDYDNIDVNEETGRHADEEVYRYDASDAERPLVCASCDPSGARPAGVYDAGPVFGEVGVEGLGLVVDRPGTWSPQQSTESDHWLAGSVPGRGKLDNAQQQLGFYQPRYLLDNGRLFFDSPDQLVPAATSVKERVYEYEPGGVGGCGSQAGCVGLISSPAAVHESVFLDASESGNDVFFMTAEPLVPQDLDGSFDVYDAHVCEASSPCLPASSGAAPPCEETPALPCKGPASSAPAFTAPASGSPAATGNLVAPGPSKPASKPPTRAQKLAKALRACKQDRKKRKRLACERTARKRYGPKQKPTKGKSKKKKQQGSGKGSRA